MERQIELSCCRFDHQRSINISSVVVKVKVMIRLWYDTFEARRYTCVTTILWRPINRRCSASMIGPILLLFRIHSYASNDCPGATHFLSTDNGTSSNCL